jgi:hypothetical protein
MLRQAATNPRKKERERTYSLGLMPKTTSIQDSIPIASKKQDE